MGFRQSENLRYFRVVYIARFGNGRSLRLVFLPALTLAFRCPAASANSALEECCRQALEFNKTTYTFIKNSIPAIAEETMTDADRRRINEEKNKGAYVMGSDASSLNHLLEKSRLLMDGAGEGGDDE